MKKSILLLICLISFVVSISATNLSGYKLIRTQEYNTNNKSSTYNAYYILSVTEDKKVIVSYYIPEDIQ